MKLAAARGYDDHKCRSLDLALGPVVRLALLLHPRELSAYTRVVSVRKNKNEGRRVAIDDIKVSTLDSRHHFLGVLPAVPWVR